MTQKDPTRAFIWFVYGFLVLVWYTNWRALELASLIPFTLLLVISGVLHGSIGRWQSRLKAPIYLAAQTLLAGVLVVMAHGQPIAAALFFPIAGEVFGIFPRAAARIASLGVLIVAWGVAMLTASGWAMIRIMAPGAVIALIFIGVYVQLFTMQMKQRERAEKLAARLEQANSQLREYSARVEELTIAEERQRMARELHDTLAQGLAGLIMQLEAIDDLLSRGDVERAQTITARAMQRARTTLHEARTTIQALRSPLERGDLVEEIRRAVDNLTADSGISCTFEVGPGDLQLTGAVADQIYRVTQEGLANIAKHSHARRAWVRLAASDDAIDLVVGDDGVGFEPAAAQTKPGHFGLTGLTERVRLVGGTLAIESSPGAGACLHATIPVPGRAES
jgi:NarL family two-component system sensor histidine kinase YdfH